MEQKQQPPAKMFPIGKRELIFGAILLAVCLLLINSILFGGLNLGFAIAYILCILCSSLYFLSYGTKPTGYSITLLVMSIVIAASFARSDDTPVKFIMACFLFAGTNLGLCLLAGKTRHDCGSISSLRDAFFTFFNLGFGELPTSCRSIRSAFRHSGSVGQKGGAILLGLGIAAPVLLVIVPLLVQADAAFEGILSHLPALSVGEIFMTVLFGLCTALVLFTRNTALRHIVTLQATQKNRKGMSPLTVNTVLIAICFVYCVYLVSQLAYFTGGFAGALPENYTLAQYARRGFFEMAWLCAINLSIIVFSLWLCKKEAHAPLFTRLLCLFIGIVTAFLVAAASAKMVLYIGSYGLTRLRVLTQVVMVFLGITTALVCIWLFVPKLPYMKAVLTAALVIGAVVSWADVDTVVAHYNVSSYLAGNAKTVDVYYLNSLGNGAVFYIDRLTREAPDESVAGAARWCIENRWVASPEDFRTWNYVNQSASNILGDPPQPDADIQYYT